MDLHTLGLFALLAGTAFVADVAYHARFRGAVGMVDALVWTGVYISAALAFAACLYFQRGPDPASLFLSGYVMEKALSIDNLMVFVAIFSYFNIPAAHEHKILHYGIVGAIVFRLIFVAIGAGSLRLFGAPVALAFGLIVLWSAFQMWTSEGGDGDEDFAAKWYARWAVKVLPFVSRQHGTFFVKTWQARATRDTLRLHGTPLLMALIAIELSDVMFSFDSVPAVIAITRDPVLIYSAMIFAILGLRMMYFVLTAAMRYLHRLPGAVVLVLFFIGIKMVTEAAIEFAHRFGLETPGYLHLGPITSMLLVLGILAGGILASIALPPHGKPDAAVER